MRHKYEKKKYHRIHQREKILCFLLENDLQQKRIEIRKQQSKCVIVPPQPAIDMPDEEDTLFSNIDSGLGSLVLENVEVKTVEVKNDIEDKGDNLKGDKEEQSEELERQDNKQKPDHQEQAEPSSKRHRREQPQY